MANCTFCGKPAGVWIHEHELCRKANAGALSPGGKANAAGVSLEEFAASQPAPKPLTAGGVFGAVLGSLCVWSLIMAVVAAFLRLVS